MKKSKIPKKRILMVGGILVVAAFIFAYSRYGLEIGQFFASEPTMSWLTAICQGSGANRKVILTWTADYQDTTPTDTVLRGTNNDNPVVIGTTTSNVRTYTDSTVAKNTTYKYRIKYGNNISSNTVTVVMHAQTCSPTSTPTPFPTTSTGPSIHLISPNGGESYVTMSTPMNIQWTGAVGHSLKLQLLNKENAALMTHTIATTPGNNGSYQWMIPTLFGGSPYTQGQFRIRATFQNGTTHCVPTEVYPHYSCTTTYETIEDTSDQWFSIYPNPVTPTPTVLVGANVRIVSPNGGEVWRKGNSYTVTWTSNPPSTSLMRVYLYRYDYEPLNGGVIPGYAALSTNTGSYTFTVPAGQPLRCQNSYTGYCPPNSTMVKAMVGLNIPNYLPEYSDGYFSITD